MPAALRPRACSSAALCLQVCPLAALLALHAAYEALLLVAGGDAAGGGGAGRSLPPVLGAQGECAEPAIGAAAFLLAISLQAYACKRVVRAYAELCTTLSPMDQPVQYAHMPLWRIALAYLGYCVAAPPPGRDAPWPAAAHAARPTAPEAHPLCLGPPAGPREARPSAARVPKRGCSGALVWCLPPSRRPSSLSSS